MYVSRYLLFVSYSREIEPASLLVGCVCFPSSLLHEKQNADERIFLRTSKRKRKIYDIPTHQFTYTVSSKEERNSKDKGFT